MSSIRIVTTSCLLQMKQSFSRTMFKFCILAYPLLYAWTLYLLYHGKSNTQFVAYVMLGTAVSSMWGSISFSSAGDIDRERFMGALPVIFTAPAPFSLIMLGKVIGNTILGVLSMILSFASVVILFGIPLQIAHVPLFLLAMAVGTLSFVFIAMALSALLALSRNTRVLMNCMDFPIFILCGTAFPIEVLPAWTQPLSYALSPTYVLKLSRMCLEAELNYSAYLHLMGGLCLLTGVYFALSLLLYRVLDIRARQTATLEVF